MSGSPDIEIALVERLRAREDRAFTELVAQHGPRMYATILRILRDPDDAADALQEAFLSAAKSIDRFEGQSQLGTWLHRIAVNAALMRRRRRRAEPHLDIDELLPRFTERGAFEQHPLPWQDSVEKNYERRELHGLILEKLEELPESYRNVILLRDIEDLSGAEAAAQLGISENAVKVRLHRARLALRELLAPLFTEAGA